MFLIKYYCYNGCGRTRKVKSSYLESYISKFMVVPVDKTEDSILFIPYPEFQEVKLTADADLKETSDNRGMERGWGEKVL